MKFIGKRLVPAFIAVFVATIMVEPSSAQEPAAVNQNEKSEAKPAGSSVFGVHASDTRDTDNAPIPTVGPVNPYAGELKEAGTGLPLFGTSTTPLRWGDFSIGGFDFMGMHNSFDPVSAGTTGFDGTVSILRTSLVFDRNLFKNRVVLQYLPQMAIVGGQIHANAGSNNTVSFGTRFSLSPRMSITLQNNLLQVHSNLLIPENYLSTSTYSGAAVQNNFLDTNGGFLADSVTSTFRYDFDQRTSVAVSPIYRYSTTTNGKSNFQASGQSYGGSVALSHALSPHRIIGVADSYQFLQQSGTKAASTRYNTISVTYSQQLTPGWWVTGNAGAGHQNYSDQPANGGWGLTSGGSIVGRISQRISTGLAYNRGVAFDTNYVSTRLSERVDLSVDVHGARFTWKNGGGYFRELGSDPRTSGKYARTGFEYNFYHSFFWFADFAHSFQNSNTPQLLSGTLNLVSFGLRWRPPVAVGR
jgi:hypothetical protein